MVHSSVLAASPWLLARHHTTCLLHQQPEPPYDMAADSPRPSHPRAREGNREKEGGNKEKVPMLFMTQSQSHTVTSALFHLLKRESLGPGQTQSNGNKAPPLEERCIKKFRDTFWPVEVWCFPKPWPLSFQALSAPLGNCKSQWIRQSCKQVALKQSKLNYVLCQRHKRRQQRILNPTGTIHEGSSI